MQQKLLKVMNKEHESNMLPVEIRDIKLKERVLTL